MKKIGIFLGIDPYAGGMFQYAQSLLHALERLPRSDYDIQVAYVGKEWECVLSTLPFNNKRIPAGNAGLLIANLFMALNFPLVVERFLSKLLNPISYHLNKQCCNLWIFPSQDVIGYQFYASTLNTIHDLMHRYEPHFPEVVSWGRFRMREKRFKSIAQTSTAILVDSEIGKQHVVESYNTPINKVFPLPYIPSINTEAKISDNDFFYKYKFPKKFFYYPAQFWKHKNHEGLLRAAASVMHIIPDLHIVFTGAKNHEFENIVLLTKELGMTNSVTFCGYVPDTEIPLFYKRARALVMPTFFGPTNIPPLEAMKHCCPIGISDVYGSKNQLQDAALYFDPKSLFSIAQALLKLWTDDELGDLLKNNATKVLAKLNQNEFAKRLQEILEQIV